MTYREELHPSTFGLPQHTYNYQLLSGSDILLPSLCNRPLKLQFGTMTAASAQTDLTEKPTVQLQTHKRNRIFLLHKQSSSTHRTTHLRAISQCN